MIVYLRNCDETNKLRAKKTLYCENYTNSNVM